VDKQVYQQFKDAFLLAFTPAQTARTAMKYIHDLKQSLYEITIFKPEYSKQQTI
jgi:hypothetical protein